MVEEGFRGYLDPPEIPLTVLFKAFYRHSFQYILKQAACRSSGDLGIANKQGEYKHVAFFTWRSPCCLGGRLVVLEVTLLTWR